jgi:NAD(P)-dependent dehydrogenase (short-subunit alcohol dehydrogenase family)
MTRTPDAVPADVASRFRLDDKVAVVTGATRGIGLAMAWTFARAGARVVISSRKAEAVEQTVSALRAAGHTAHGLATHMGDVTQARALAAEAVGVYGGIDIVVNNAATNPTFGPLSLTDAAMFDKILDVNLKGPLALARAAHESMQARGGGSIVNIASIGGVSPEAGLGLYSVSKAALVSLTKVMAQEWGADGVRANVICPGLIRTRFSATLWENDHIAGQVLGHQPIRRIGEPEDVAGLALFLASDASAYCTGSVYLVDGGYLL